MSDTLDIPHLVRQIQADRSAEEPFQRLFETYFEPLTRFFVKRGFIREVGEDLAQECFLRVYKKIGEFRFEASFETWLFHIAANIWKNALRDQAAQKRKAESASLDEMMDASDPADGRGFEPRDATASQLDEVLSDERTRLLAEALDELPPRMRECMLLRVGQGLKYREIATLLKLSIATVKTQLGLGHKRLRPLLERHSDVFEL